MTRCESLDAHCPVFRSPLGQQRFQALYWRENCAVMAFTSAFAACTCEGCWVTRERTHGHTARADCGLRLWSTETSAPARRRGGTRGSRRAGRRARATDSLPAGARAPRSAPAAPSGRRPTRAGESPRTGSAAAAARGTWTWTPARPPECAPLRPVAQRGAFVAIGISDSHLKYTSILKRALTTKSLRTIDTHSSFNVRVASGASSARIFTWPSICEQNAPRERVVNSRATFMWI